jgi:hypothetical protein
VLGGACRVFINSIAANNKRTRDIIPTE